MKMIESMRKEIDAARPKDIAWYVRIGAVATLFFVGTTIVWATIAPIEGAVIAVGNVVVENNISRVQHPTGGPVGAVLVREGQHVAQGDILVKLDETLTRSSLQIVVNELVTLRARQARLNAERDGTAILVMPRDLIARVASEPNVKQAIETETALFVARERTRRGQRSQLEEQINQLNQEIVGNSAQYQSATEQVRVAELELVDMRMLLSRNLVQRPRVTQLEREVSRIKGTMGELTAKVAQIRARISETNLQIIQIERTLETEVARETRETETKINELNERLASAEDQLRRIDLRSPSHGVVHQLQIHNVGSVIAPGAVIMQIVPDKETLIIEARVNPIDIDQMYPDQPARVRFTAFNSRTTPELQGHVFRIGADINKDERTGNSYYLIGIRVPDSERVRLGKLRLIPGMPAESFIKTSERTVASFLFKPLLEHMNRGFREE